MAFPGDWSYYRELTLDNSDGGALTDFQQRVVLSADNFDFTNAESDGADIRFSESPHTTELEYWIESYDDTAEQAVIWVQVSISAASSKTLRLWYGYASAVDASDPDTVFEYFNALETTGDRDDLSSTVGTATWTAVTDTGAPGGNAIDCSNTGNDAGRYKTLSLPAAHAVEHWLKQTNSGGCWAGPLINQSASNTYYRPGSSYDYSAAALNAVQIRKLSSGSATNYASDGDSDAAMVSTNEWAKLVTIYKPKKYFSGLTNYSAGAAIQGIAWNDADAEYVVSETNAITRYNTSGTSQETTTSVPSGTSWGDAHVKDNKIWIVRYYGTTSTAVYSFADTNLAGGYTLEASLTSDMDTGANGITFDGTNWIIGETDSTATSVHLYVFNTSWVLQKTIVVPRAGNDSYGIQGLEYVDGMLYMATYGRHVIVGRWNPAAMDFHVTDYIASEIAADGGLQAMAWNQTDSVWYLGNRTDSRVEERTILEHATDKRVFSYWTGSGDSHAIPTHVITSPNTQSLFGIGAYRSCRFAQLFVRQQAANEPSFSVGAEVPATTTHEAGLTFAASLAASPAANAVFEAAAAFASTQSASPTGTATLLASLSFGGTLGVASDGDIATGPQTIEAALSVGVVQSMSQLSVASLFAATTLGNQLAFTVVGGNAIEAAITYALTHSQAQIADISIEGSLAVGLTQGVSSSANTNLEAGTGISHQLGLQLIAGSVIEAGLDLSSIVSVNTAGAVLIVGVQTPDGRVITISADDRVITIN